MGKSVEAKKQLLSQIEAIKKINDNPKVFSGNVSDKYLENIPSVDTFVGKKQSDLSKKIKAKKENTKDIFSDLIDVAERFISTNKKTNTNTNFTDPRSAGPVNVKKNPTKQRLKSHSISAGKTTLNSAKEIIVKRLSEILFMGEGICGTESAFPVNSITVSPEEFDVFNMLTIDPDSNCGVLIYEKKNTNTGKQKVNRELYNMFNGGTYTFNANNGNKLFDSSWDSGNQRYIVSGLTGNTNVQSFIQDYYSSTEFPDIAETLSTNMFITLQGQSSCSESRKFLSGLDGMLKLFSNLLTICGSPTKTDELKNQTAVDLFSETDEDIEFYFNFDDTEGIDLDDDDQRYRRVLRFKDCYNFEIEVDDMHVEDFIYLNKNTDIENAIDSTLNNVSLDATEQADNGLSLDDFLNNLLSNFILGIPKSILLSLLNAKIFFPIVILYKIFKEAGLTIKQLLKRLYKAVSNIVKDLFWLFLREFWNLVKIDLLAFVATIVKKILKNKYARYLLIITSLIALLKKILEDGIDNCYELFQTILNTIQLALSAGAPISVPPILLATAGALPGYSQDRAFMNIMERLESSGVPTGPLFGEDNDIGYLVKSIIDGHTEEEDKNSFVKIVLNPGVLPGPPLAGGAVIPPAVISGVGKKF